MFNFNEQFFSKYQSKLLFIANKWYLRWILGLHRLPKNLKGKTYSKITTNSIHWEIKKTKRKVYCRGVFFSRPCFAESLSYNLSPIAYFQIPKNPVWRFSPVGVLGCLTLILFPKLFGGFFFFGTVTDYDSGAGDGYIGQASYVSTWDTAHNALSATAYPTATTIYARSRHNTTGGGYAIQRLFFPINTAALPQSAIISAATFSLYVGSKADNDNDGDDWLNLVQTTQPSNTTLGNGDFDLCGSVDNPTEGATRIDLGDITTGAYNVWTLDATGRGWIVLDGYTKLGMREGHDCIDSSIGTNLNNYIGCSSSEAANQPYLEVTYTFTPVAPTVTTQAVTNVGITTATGNGNVTSNGDAAITERGVCYIQADSGTPTTADTTSHDHTDAEGAFTMPMTGLTGGLPYRVRAYAINSEGTSYGVVVDMTTSTTSIKTVNGLAKASVKTVNGVAIANVKTWNGLP